MKAQQVLAELRNLGVSLKAEGEVLRFWARKGVLTPELRAVLSEQKSEILNLLKPNESVKPERKPEAEQSAPLPVALLQSWRWIEAEGCETVSDGYLCELLTKANQSKACLMRFRGKLSIGEREDTPIRRDLLCDLIAYGEAIGRFLEGAGLKDSFCIECGQSLIFELSKGYGYKRAICNDCGWMRIW